MTAEEIEGSADVWWRWIDAINPTIGIAPRIEHVIDRDLLQFQYERTLEKHGIPLVPYSERQKWRPPEEPRVHLFISGGSNSNQGFLYLISATISLQVTVEIRPGLTVSFNATAWSRYTYGIMPLASIDSQLRKSIENIAEMMAHLYKGNRPSDRTVDKRDSTSAPSTLRRAYFGEDGEMHWDDGSGNVSRDVRETKDEAERKRSPEPQAPPEENVPPTR